MRSSGLVYKPPRRKIVRLFSASLMSNTKWRKMFVMLGRDNANVGLKQAFIKLIDEEMEYSIAAPEPSNLHLPGSYIDLPSGRVAFSSIEWIEYPLVARHERRPPNGTGRLPPSEIVQDLDKAEAVIRKLGQYPLERTERGLRIWGYSGRRTQS